MAQLTGHFTLRSGLVSETYFDKYRFEAAIPGQHLSALISICYISIFRKDKIIFFNSLRQNHSV